MYAKTSSVGEIQVHLSGEVTELGIPFRKVNVVAPSRVNKIILGLAVIFRKPSQNA